MNHCVKVRGRMFQSSIFCRIIIVRVEEKTVFMWIIFGIWKERRALRIPSWVCIIHFLIKSCALLLPSILWLSLPSTIMFSGEYRKSGRGIARSASGFNNGDLSDAILEDAYKVKWNSDKKLRRLKLWTRLGVFWLKATLSSKFFKFLPSLSERNSF